MIFERITNRTQHDFISAVYQCAMNKSSPTTHSTTLTAVTIQEACTKIQSNNAHNQLNDILTSTIQSYYSCTSCQNVSDDLSLSIEQVFIFKYSSTRQLTAYPIIPINQDEINRQQCSICAHHSKINSNMDPQKQKIIQCPPCSIVNILLIYFFSINNSISKQLFSFTFRFLSIQQLHQKTFLNRLLP